MLEKQQEERLRLKSKFKKLKRKLVSEGKLETNDTFDVKDNVEELERELVPQELERRTQQRSRHLGRDTSSSGVNEEKAGPSSQSSAPQNTKPGKPQKQPSQIQRLAAKVEQEKDAANAAREQVIRQRAEKQAKFEASQRERQRLRQNHLRKTSKGQPIMKYRMEEILSVLEAGRKR